MRVVPAPLHFIKYTFIPNFPGMLLWKKTAQLTPEGLDFHYMLACSLWSSFQFLSVRIRPFMANI